VGFAGSYLWRLRQKVGSDLLLMPGAMVVIQRPDGMVLLTKRIDDGTWCLPAGAAEEGSSFAETAIAELREEAGAIVSASGLEPFGCLSRAADHTIAYPNGDVTHCFAMCFLARNWSGDLHPDGAEVEQVDFFGLDSPPAPIHGPSEVALGMFRHFLASGEFQVR
jgi:8-oxo-dGTP pyrophosphatase MutT (NUDIX family)